MTYRNDTRPNGELATEDTLAASEGVGGFAVELFERTLRERLAGRAMVCELNLSEADFRSHRKALFTALRTLSPKACAKRFPASYVTHLAMTGTLLYDGDGFWPLTHPRIHEDPDAGAYFRRALMVLGMETFDAVFQTDEHAWRWVTPILAQGGVPKAAAAPFVEALRHAIDDHGSDANDIVALWQVAPERTLRSINRATRRFFIFGGEPAADFLQRCVDALLELDAESADKRTSIESTDAGIPSFLIDAMASAGPVTHRASARPTVRRPRLTLDPMSALGPVVTLPTVHDEMLDGTWSIRAGGQQTRVEASAYAPEVVPVPPVGTVEVQFEKAGLEPRTWELSVADRDRVALFDGDGRAVNTESGVVGAEAVYLLARQPSDIRIVGSGVDGQSRPDPGSCPSPIGEWAGFDVVFADLRGAQRLEVWQDGQVGHSWLVIPAKAKPELAGRAVSGLTASGGVPVYDAMPSVQLPAAPGLRAAIWTAYVELQTGDPQSFALTPDDSGRMVFPPEVEYHGLVNLRVRGPLGMDLRERFAVVPNLHAELPRGLVMPGSEAPVVRLRAPGASFDGEPEGSTVERTVDDIGATGAMIDLRYGDGRTLRLNARVARLRWSVGHGGTALPKLASAVVRLTRQDFDDFLPDLLYVDAGGALTATKLVLREAREGSVIAETEVVYPRAGTSGWTFNLGQFADTIRDARGARLGLFIRVGVAEVHAVDIVGELRPERIRLTSDEGGSTVTVSISTRDLVPGTVVRLWPTWEPWRAGLEVELDPATQTAKFDRDDDLRPGEYLVEVAVDDPWSSSSATRPSGSQSAATRGKQFVGDKDETVAWLASLEPSDPLTRITWALGGYDGSGVVPPSAFVACSTELALGLEAVMSDLPYRVRNPRQLHYLWDLASGTDETLANVLVGFHQLTDGSASMMCRLLLRTLSQAQPKSDVLAAELWSQLWNVAPPVAALLDLPWARHDLNARQRSASYLGWQPGELSPAADNVRLDQPWLKRSPDQLREILAQLQLPGGILQAGAQMHGVLQWLTAQYERPDSSSSPEQWYLRWGYLANLRAVPIPEALRAAVEKHVAGRQAAPGSERWAATGAVLLAAAARVLWYEPATGSEAVEALEEALPWATVAMMNDLTLLASLPTILAEAP